MDDRQARLQQVAHIAVALEAQTGCPAPLMICAVGTGTRRGARPLNSQLQCYPHTTQIPPRHCPLPLRKFRNGGYGRTTVAFKGNLCYGMRGFAFIWHERTVAEDQTWRDAVLSPVEVSCGRRAVERRAGAALSSPRVAPRLPRSAWARRGVCAGPMRFSFAHRSSRRAANPWGTVSG